MIICSKREGNGTYREFVMDDREVGERMAVKTHITHRVGATMATDEWREAGVITRSPKGLLEAAVIRPGPRAVLVKIDRFFPNEIAALQAIATSYEAAPVPTH